jgi:DMSO reductase anchor subunit
MPLMTASLLFPGLLGVSAVVGVAGLSCSAMIYVDTRRLFWRATQTVPRFFGTMALVPLAIVAPSVAAFALMAKVGWETRTFFGRSISSRLQHGALGSAVACRDLLAVTAAFLLLTSPGLTGLALLVAGELAERYIFFRAVDAPKMPGVAA